MFTRELVLQVGFCVSVCCCLFPNKRTSTFLKKTANCASRFYVLRAHCDQIIHFKTKHNLCSSGVWRNTPTEAVFLVFLFTKRSSWNRRERRHTTPRINTNKPTNFNRFVRPPWPAVCKKAKKKQTNKQTNKHKKSFPTWVLHRLSFGANLYSHIRNDVS